MKKIFISTLCVLIFLSASRAQKQATGSRRDTSSSRQQVPYPLDTFYIHNQIEAQPNSNFNITGTGIFGSNLNVPLIVRSSNELGTDISVTNTNNTNANWRFHVSGAATGPGSLSVINMLTNRAAITFSRNGFVKINSIVQPDVALDVNGDIEASGNIHASGNFLLGIQYLKQESSMNQGYQMFTLNCPAGYQVISGGGGNRDLNGTVKDIHVAFSGPDEDAPATRWRLYLYNSSKSSRAVVIYCNCAKVK